MTRGDRLVVAGVLALAALAWPATYLAAAGRADVAVVTGPGGTSQIALRPDRTLEIEGARGPLTLRVRDGAVSVLDAPCPDRLCVHQGQVCAAGAALVCVPNGVSVRVGGGSDALDAVIR
ncbi:MAG: NusG domain II-containing protein [Coriobacteriia bacterium]|nr:NusG domain II-containing protein [Coriobacteriia bacterium]